MMFRVLRLINIAIILIILGFFSFSINYSYAKDGSITFSNILPNINFDMLKIIESHAATVALIGIGITFASVEIQRYRQKRDNMWKDLSYNIAYFEAIGFEVETIKNLMNFAGKLKETKYDIYDVVFPTEAYDKMSIIEVESKDTKTRLSILYFYNIVKKRNRMYIHRNEVKHRFIRTSAL